MKYFTRFIILIFIVCLTSLTSCRTMRTSEKTVSESETASVTASRLTFYRTLDSLSRQFRLSADSIIMIFATSPESPREYPSGMECPLETPSDSQSIPHNPARKRIRNASRSASATRPSQVPSYLLPPSGPSALKIYGLHIADNSEEKSFFNADLKDSMALATQSQKSKSAIKQKTTPSATFKWLVIILTAFICISFALILIRFIHKHTFLA
ncbi:hypothetical protein SAMN04487900_103183 [Prevotella communis]|uniref:Lipoprotein n=1 Tax=Prevotella communis TaxID=2913614 RepID=A0A1H0EIY0_9BACT|nr:hypothetical protein SAMN04487900_103183 [Prevotella communis]